MALRCWISITNGPGVISGNMESDYYEPSYITFTWSGKNSSGSNVSGSKTISKSEITIKKIDYGAGTVVYTGACEIQTTLDYKYAGTITMTASNGNVVATDNLQWNDDIPDDYSSSGSILITDLYVDNNRTVGMKGGKYVVGTKLKLVAKVKSTYTTKTVRYILSGAKDSDNSWGTSGGTVLEADSTMVKAGLLNVTVEVTDSRGNTAKKTIQVTIHGAEQDYYAYYFFNQTLTKEFEKYTTNSEKSIVTSEIYKFSVSEGDAHEGSYYLDTSFSKINGNIPLDDTFNNYQEGTYFRCAEYVYFLFGDELNNYIVKNNLNTINIKFEMAADMRGNSDITIAPHDIGSYDELKSYNNNIYHGDYGGYYTNELQSKSDEYLDKNKVSFSGKKNGDKLNLKLSVNNNTKGFLMKLDGPTSNGIWNTQIKSGVETLLNIKIVSNISVKITLYNVYNEMTGQVDPKNVKIKCYAHDFETYNSIKNLKHSETDLTYITTFTTPNITQSAGTTFELTQNESNILKNHAGLAFEIVDSDKLTVHGTRCLVNITFISSPEPEEPSSETIKSTGCATARYRSWGEAFQDDQQTIINQALLSRDDAHWEIDDADVQTREAFYYFGDQIQKIKADTTVKKIKLTFYITGNYSAVDIGVFWHSRSYPDVRATKYLDGTSGYLTQLVKNGNTYTATIDINKIDAKTRGFILSMSEEGGTYTFENYCEVTTIR